MSVDVVVINLTRFGDLLQCQSLIDDLALANYKVGLICLENFAPATELMRNLTKVWPLPGAKLMMNLNNSWRNAADDLLSFTAQIPPATVLNLTPTLPARLLTSLLATDKVLGFGLDKDGYGINHGIWASFISVAARKRINAPFNLSDMLRRLALPLTGDLKGSFRLKDPADEALVWCKNFLASVPEGDFKGFVGFQLGASEKRRRWPLQYFMILGQWLWDKYKLIPILLGNAQENDLGKNFNVSYPVINAIGKTTLPQLSALLRQCKFLVTNDTGTMHLASGLGIPGISFFLATAQPWDTGPLMPGWCCLEPNLPCHPCAFSQKCSLEEKCREQISPEAVYGILEGWLETGEWNSCITPQIAEQCRVWITEKDLSGFTKLQPVSNQENTERSIWLTAMAGFWSQFLDSLDFPDKNNIPSARPIKFFENTESKQKLSGILDQCVTILDSMPNLSNLAKTSRKGGELLLRNCERVQSLLEKSPYLASLAAFWREFRQNQGDNLPYFLNVVSKYSCAIRNLNKNLTLNLSGT